MHPYLAAFKKNTGMFWWRQCWQNQTIPAKATRALQGLHIFVYVEWHEDDVYSRNVDEYVINEKLSWRQSWVGCTNCHKKLLWNFRKNVTANQIKTFPLLLTAIWDVFTPTQIFLKYLIISEVDQKALVMSHLGFSISYDEVVKCMQ